jgi:L-iditol 2-dehydrogenase
LRTLRSGHPRVAFPWIIGHEVAGTVAAVGTHYQGPYRIGTRLAVGPLAYHPQDEFCLEGRHELCAEYREIGQHWPGGFAEYLAIPPLALAGGNVIKVPESVPDDMAALSEPLSCGLNAQQIAGVEAGASVLIIGGGPLGALNAELAKARGASQVMIVQRSEPRLSWLRRIDGITVIDGARQDVGAVVQAHTDGLGADVVIVCAPTREAQETAVHYARKGGAVSLFASLPKGDADIVLDSRLVHYNELRISGASDSRPEHVTEAVRLMAAGKIDSEPIITHRIGLGELHHGLALMKKKESLKVLVYPEG